MDGMLNFDPMENMEKIHKNSQNTASVNDKSILVVKREKLFGAYNTAHFEGFSPIGKIDFYKRVTSNYIWMNRHLAETNPLFKQIVPYAVILNADTGRIFSYRRSLSVGESRLKGRISIGVGGHVEPKDGKNPIYAAMLRELREEVTLEYKDAHIIGFINTEEDEVGKVHFGFCYLIESGSDVEPNESSLIEAKMASISSLEKHYHEMETWSKIAFSQIKKMIGV